MILTEIKMENLKNIFDDIYTGNKWGGQSLYSGDGSHNPDLINPYLNSIKWFFDKMNRKPNVVDFGCGDFNIGSKIRPLCNDYAALDISENVISTNIEKYAGINVNFLRIDARTEDIPDGDVIFIRQVFQHLSNEAIFAILPKLKKFKFIIFTDHIPSDIRFLPNVNVETGRMTRLLKGSGVVLTAFPFQLNPVNEILLCAIPSEGGIIKTVIYQMF